MTEAKYPWVVVVVGDGYAVARNGRDGFPKRINPTFISMLRSQTFSKRVNKDGIE